MTRAEPILMALRNGVVPPEGLEYLATGLEPLTEAVQAELDAAANGTSSIKWVRGSYGAGKTFTTRYLCEVARQRGFATAEVQISVNDTPLHHLETVYRRLIERLTTKVDGVGAFRAVVDGWLYEVGEEVTRLTGISEDDPSFIDETEKRLQVKLADLSTHSSSFARVLGAYHRAQADGDFASAQGLVSWLGGDPHVGRAVLGKAGVKGKVDGQAALTFLRGLLLLLRQSGYKGLVVVLDEVETIQRMNAQTRDKSLNVLRQFIDMTGNDELPHLYMLITGTPDFYESHKGIRGYEALHQRVSVKLDPNFPNWRAKQVALLAFDAERLRAVGRKVRTLFPESVQERVDDPFLDALIRSLTERFGGQVSITPRLFLRELVDVLDKTAQYDSYVPMEHHELHLDEDALAPSELAALNRDDAPPAAKPRRARLDD